MRYKQRLFTFTLPLLLLFHNTVDFTYYGATWCYKECLSYFMTNFANEMEEQRRLKLVSHFGCMDDCIYSIGLHWQLEEQVNVDQARLLLLELMDAFLIRLNDFKRLRPYLWCYPWNICRIQEMRIDFPDRCYNHYPSPGILSNVTYMDGTFTYNIESLQCPGQTMKQRDESYCDALHFVGWGCGAKHRNTLLQPLPPIGSCEDVHQAMLDEAESYYYVKRRLFLAESEGQPSRFDQPQATTTQTSTIPTPTPQREKPILQQPQQIDVRRPELRYGESEPGVSENFSFY